MIVEHRGWRIVRLRNGDTEVDVVPEKGGDITALRFRGRNLLWESPWGLRPRALAPDAGSSAERWLQMYPGGWQTIFPNGGEESEGIGFHGEACLVPYDDESHGNTTTLRARIPGFDIERVVEVRTDGIAIDERITNTSSRARDAMWSHHPAFAIDGRARVDCGAAGYVVDDLRDAEHGDLEPGATTAWPFARARDGSAVDLRALPPDGEPLDRFGYCTSFEDGWATSTCDERQVRLTWDAHIFPAAWYWLEARATRGAPWFGKAYVFAIEPASTWPGQGLAKARAKGNGPITFAPGETKTVGIELKITQR
ncbi:MAG: hypothetical protein ABR552_03420 [Actinomycetota bacterium]